MNSNLKGIHISHNFLTFRIRGSNACTLLCMFFLKAGDWPVSLNAILNFSYWKDVLESATGPLMTLKNKKTYPGFKFDVILNKLQNLGCAVDINPEDHITSAGLCLNYFIRKVSWHALGFFEILNMIFPRFHFSFLSRNNIGVLFLQFWLFSGLGWSFIWASLGCGSLEPMFKGCNYYSWVGSSRTRILHECLHQRFVEGEEPDLTWPDLPCRHPDQMFPKCTLPKIKSPIAYAY